MPTLPVIELSKQVSAPLITMRTIQPVWRALRRLVAIPKPWQQISIAVVGDAKMRQLNQRYRQQPTVTDVLSFPYGADGGEIVLCYPQAKRQAHAKQVPLQRELNWLLVHGLLHLLGYDHERARDALVMRPLEQAILAYV